MIAEKACTATAANERFAGYEHPDAQQRAVTRSVLDDLPAVLYLWEQLLVQHQVKGKSGHDARLVASMIVHGIDRLLTFNTADLARYQQIVAISPQDIVGTPPSP